MSKKNDNKKKKRSKIPVIILIIVLIFAVLCILSKLGFGGGGGFGKCGNGGNSTSENSVSSENSKTAEEWPTEEVPTETNSESQAETVVYMDVTVSGDILKIGVEEKSADDIVSLAKETGAVVRITDENAVNDAMESLISALDENNIPHTES